MKDYMNANKSTKYAFGAESTAKRVAESGESIRKPVTRRVSAEQHAVDTRRVKRLERHKARMAAIATAGAGTGATSSFSSFASI